MNKKILLVLIAIIAIVIVAVGVVALSSNIFGQTTEVDNKFIKATIPGVAVEEGNTTNFNGWLTGYMDDGSGVSYGFAMFNNLNLTKDMFSNFLNLNKLATKEVNGVQWDIYYMDINSFKNTPFSTGLSSSDTGAMYLCFASGKTGDYMVIVGSDVVSSDNSIDSDLFKNYVEPLLQSITLKDPQNSQGEYKFFNMTEVDYNNVKNFVNTNGWDAVTSQM